MESMLERLLQIQGGSEQMTMEVPPASPAPVEVAQLFNRAEALGLGAMKEAGEIELLEPLIFYRSSGLVYAHFRLMSKAANMV